MYRDSGRELVQLGLAWDFNASIEDRQGCEESLSLSF